MSEGEKRSRCYLVYAIAPEDMSARDRERHAERLHRRAGARADRLARPLHRPSPRRVRGLRSGSTEDEEAKLADPGALAGWELSTHPLTFSMTALGFIAQAEFTLRNYGDTWTRPELEAAEKPEKRFWWRKPKHRGA